MDMQCHNQSRKLRPAIFLDRDGTINVEKNYLYRFEDWEWISGAQAAITTLNNAGFLVVVVSNQAGVARGLYTEQDVTRLHKQVSADLERNGGKIDAFYYCPHHPDFGDVCCCRKPAPGMLQRAAEDLGIDLSRSWMIGDKAIDIQAGQLAGVFTALVRTGYGKNESRKVFGARFIADSLCDVVGRIVPQRILGKFTP